jgi:hypothetical protein
MTWPWKTDPNTKLLQSLNEKADTIMATMADLQTDVANLKTAVASTATNLAKLFADYKAAVASAADPAVLAQLDTDINAQITALNTATTGAVAP